jgi:hypothetical protein
MYLGMQMSFELLCRTIGDLSEYDLIFRCRPDLWLQDKVSDFFNRMREPKVYIPNHSHYRGYCDQFAGGPPQLMKHVLTAYQAITSYDGEKMVLNGERILRYWLDRHGVAAAELPFEFKIYRPAFVGMRYDDIPRFSNAYRNTPEGAATPALTSIHNESKKGGPLIDLSTSSVEAVRSSVELLVEQQLPGPKESILRLREDTTDGDGHDLRLAARPDRVKNGSYALVAAFRPLERRNICLFLHRRWQDQILFAFDAARAAPSIKHVRGDAFRLRRLSSQTISGWAYLRAEIDILDSPGEVEISVHLADDAGRHHYDGDGRSAIDIKIVSLSLLPGADL